MRRGAGARDGRWVASRAASREPPLAEEVTVPAVGSAAARRRQCRPNGPSIPPAAAAAVLRREARPYVGRGGFAAFSPQPRTPVLSNPARDGAGVVTDDGKQFPVGEVEGAVKRWGAAALGVAGGDDRNCRRRAASSDWPARFTPSCPRVERSGGAGGVGDVVLVCLPVVGQGGAGRDEAEGRQEVSGEWAARAIRRAHDRFSFPPPADVSRPLYRGGGWPSRICGRGREWEVSWSGISCRRHDSSRM